MKIALIQQHSTQNREDNIQRGVSAFREAAESGGKPRGYFAQDVRV